MTTPDPLSTTAAIPSVHFEIYPANLHRHLFDVQLTIARPAAQQELVLPVWIAGSYLVREFSKHLLGIVAEQNGQPCVVQQLDKHHWQLHCRADAPVQVRYQVLAHDSSVRTAWLDVQRGFFNPTSLCLMVVGQIDSPQHLTLYAPVLQAIPIDTMPEWVRAASTPAAAGTPAPSAISPVASPAALPADARPACVAASAASATALVESACVAPAGQHTHHNAYSAYSGHSAHSWRVATTLPAVQVDAQGFGTYVAPDYDALADHPVEMGTFWQQDFDVLGVPHRFAISTPPAALDGARLLDDVRRICEAEMRFWHGAQAGATDVPFSRYLFLLNAVQDGYGGLEHRDSTALIASRHMLPRVGDATSATGDAYVTLLGLISHEYFHTWNVKRLKPRAFLPYDYTRENYTELLWFFEGFTSYYDDLLLLRAGCIDIHGYLRQLQKTVDSVRNTPGRAIHSAAQASFEAWTKYYRPDAHTPNITVSYYTKGALIALCLDLTLRAEGHTTLDDVMRTLWQRHASTGLTEADVLSALHELGGRSFAAEIAAWVHGTDELPLADLLPRAGVRLAKAAGSLAQQWGLRCTEGAAGQGSIRIQTVYSHSAAEATGLCPGDEWLGLQYTHHSQPYAWRISSLQDVQTYLPPADATHPSGPATVPESVPVAIIARDGCLLHLPITRPAPSQSQWKLELDMPAERISSQTGWPWV